MMPVDFAPGCDLYLAWNISVSSGSECQGAPALAIDNVVLTAVPEPVPAYDCHIYIDDRTGYDTIGVYAYGDKEIWGAWPGQAPINEETIDGTTYKVFGHNEASGSYNLIVNNWNRSLQLPDYPIEGGRDYYFMATPEKLTEIVPTGIEETEIASEGELRLKGDNLMCEGAAGIEVYTLAGTLAARAAGESLTLSALPAGTYIALATSDTFRSTLRFLKH